jgi:hypothetical protein
MKFYIQSLDHLAAVIARLDRAIQYSRSVVTGSPGLDRAMTERVR